MSDRRRHNAVARYCRIWHRRLARGVLLPERKVAAMATAEGDHALARFYLDTINPERLAERLADADAARKSGCLDKAVAILAGMTRDFEFVAGRLNAFATRRHKPAPLIAPRRAPAPVRAVIFEEPEPGWFDAELIAAEDARKAVIEQWDQSAFLDRLRSGRPLSDADRQLAADLIEGKITGPKHRPARLQKNTPQYWAFVALECRVRAGRDLKTGERRRLDKKAAVAETAAALHLDPAQVYAAIRSNPPGAPWWKPVKENRRN